MFSKNALESKTSCLHITSKPGPNLFGRRYPLTVTASIRSAKLLLQSIAVGP